MYTGAAKAQTARMQETQEAAATELDQRTHEALTDLHAYVLALDAEWRRSRRAELSEELVALRAALTALRERLDPGGRYF
jgi:hypothetical protein